MSEVIKSFDNEIQKELSAAAVKTNLKSGVEDDIPARLKEQIKAGGPNVDVLAQKLIQSQ